MDNNARITIVVTLYNKEKYIRQCLESIFNQTDSDFELIIIDDESTDNSYAICQQCCESKDCTLVTQPHSGTSFARNKGIELAKTDYIYFVDGDDWIAPDTIKILNEAVASEYKMVVFGFYYTREDGQVFSHAELPDCSYTNRLAIQENLVELWDSNLMYSSCNKLFSLDIIRQHGIAFQNKDFGEDLTFVCTYSSFCDSILTINPCLYYYREHQLDSQSKRIRDNIFEIRKTEYFELYRFFDNMGSLNDKSVEYMSRRYIERIIGCIENEASYLNKKASKEKRSKISAIINDETVVESLKYAKLRSRKMKILSWLLKRKMERTTFLFGVFISVIKNKFPKLFFKLKMKR